MSIEIFLQMCIKHDMIWEGDTSVDMTIISLGVPCLLSSVFDDNEDEYVLSYISFSKCFVDVSPYEQDFFPQRIVFKQR